MPEGWNESYRTEDRRWRPREQLRDWLLLAAMIAVVIGYHLLIYLFEPGLRDAG